MWSFSFPDLIKYMIILDYISHVFEWLIEKRNKKILACDS